MLPSGHPSGPSYSSKSVAGAAVGADPVTFAADTPSLECQDHADLIPPCPKFSIRDYVLDSRSKGIKRSWPFHPQSLELCLNCDVKDVLPPFEPPGLIRSRFSYTCIHFEQSAMCSEVDASAGLVKIKDASSSHVNTTAINFQSCRSVDESLGPSQYTPKEEGKTATEEGRNTNEPSHTTEFIQADQQDKVCTKAMRRIGVAVPSCRLKNLGSSHETSEKKCNLIVRSGSVTNIRQRKDVSSNSSSVSDPKAWKTCPVCEVFSSTSNTTLNAHIDQCLYAESNTELVVETVIVKPKVKQRKKQLMVEIYKTALPYTLEDLDRRNGTNWAIESSLRTSNKEVCTKKRSPEVVPFEARDDERDRDVYVDSNGIKIRILSKCSDAPLVFRDKLSLKKVAKHETGKSISMTKTFLESKTFRNEKFKVHGKKFNRLNHFNSQDQAYPDGDMHDDTSEEEPAMHTRKPAESTSCGGLETIKQRVCSKRVDIAKNFSRKLDSKASDSTQAFSPKSPEEMAITLEASDDDRGNGSSKLLGSIPRWSSNNLSSSSVMPKVPRSAAALAKRKIKEIGRREAYKSDNYDKARNSTLLKSSGVHRLSISNTRPSYDPNRVASTSKVLRKHRSVPRARKREFSPFISGLVHGFGQQHELDHRHVNKKFGVTNNDTPKKVVKRTQEDTADNGVSYGIDVSALGQGNDQYDVAQQTTDTNMDFEGEEPATRVQYASASRNTHEDCCSVISSGSLSPENSNTDDDVLAKGNVAREDPCSTEQSTHHTHVSNIVANNEMGERQTNAASTKESSASFTNNRDMAITTPQDNSSITSNRDDFNQDHGFLAFDRDLSDSPISIASTMPPPIALKDSSIKESEPGPSTVNVRTVQENMSGSSNKETKSMPLAREGEHLPNEKHYCCSCQASISRESQAHHETSTARSLTFTKEQVPQLDIGLRASSSFRSYQRTGRKANPCLDLHDQPSASKVSTESTMCFPSYTANYIRPSLQTPTPSPPSPMLRLMGKNLMVMNSQESGHPQAPSSEYAPRGNYMAPVGFMSPNYQHSDSAFINRTPAITSHQIPIPSVQAGNFVGPPFHGGSMVQFNHQSLQKPYRNVAPVMHHPAYMMNEVMMMKDSPVFRSGPQVGLLLPTGTYPASISVPNTTAPRPFYCLPSPIQILPKGSVDGSMPVFTNINPVIGVSTVSQSKQVRYRQSLHLTSSLGQSPEGYINPPVYYLQNLPQQLSNPNDQ